MTLVSKKNWKEKCGVSQWLLCSHNSKLLRQVWVLPFPEQKTRSFPVLYSKDKVWGEMCLSYLPKCKAVLFSYCLEEKYLFRTDFLFAQEMDYQGAQSQESWVRTTRWWRSKIILWSSATWGAGWSTSRWLVGPTPAHSGTRTYNGKSREQFLSHTTLVYLAKTVPSERSSRLEYFH